MPEDKPEEKKKPEVKHEHKQEAKEKPETKHEHKEAKPENKEEAKPVPAAKPETKPDAEAKPVPKPEAPRVDFRDRKKVAVINVYSSKNDTIITATDLSGAETFAWASGGMIVKSDREEGRPYAAMQAAIKVVSALKEKGISFVNVRIRAPGGVGSKTPGQGAQAVVRTVARSGVRILKIEDVTPLPTDSMKRKGGRRGRRV
jgi:small subunit ribosomal protein S11